MAAGLGADELEALYERFAPVVHRRALALLGRDADAWDVVQEVFEKMLSGGENFRGEARPMTYVYRVATNLCLNHLRSRALREPLAMPDGEPSFEPGHVEAANFIRALASRLSERELAIATLLFFDGLSQEEIADTLGLSRKTIGRELDEIRRRAEELRHG